MFWVVLPRIWHRWRKALQLVKADTVVGWQRKGFRIYWARISRQRSAGQPEVSVEVGTLIKRMATANPNWGAPRIHGELLKLGIKIAERTVSRLMPETDYKNKRKVILPKVTREPELCEPAWGRQGNLQEIYGIPTFW